MRIETFPGSSVKEEVDRFYAAEGGNARARPDDFFFLLYLGNELAGAVRFCEEEGYPMLRSMRIAKEHQGKGLGKCLLAAFTEFLDEENIRAVFCLPYDHLELFYGNAGFTKVDVAKVPPFLRARIAEYNLKTQQTLCMMRP